MRIDDYMTEITSNTNSDNTEIALKCYSVAGLTRVMSSFFSEWNNEQTLIRER